MVLVLLIVISPLTCMIWASDKDTLQLPSNSAIQEKLHTKGTRKQLKSTLAGKVHEL